MAPRRWNVRGRGVGGISSYAWPSLWPTVSAEISRCFSTKGTHMNERFESEREFEAPKICVPLSEGLAKQLFDTARALRDAIEREPDSEDEIIMIEGLGARIRG